MKNYQCKTSLFIISGRSQRFVVFLLATVITILLIFNNGYAQPVISLRTRPNIQIIEIGSDIVANGIIITAEPQTFRFEWSLDGLGEFKGDTNNPAIFYFPPDEIPETSMEVVITVKVTNENNEIATYNKVFTLRAPPTPTPTATPSPTPTITPIQTPSMIEQLLEQADRYFENEWFLTPKETNAFDLYHEVLRLDPDNLHAREKLREMTKQYKEWGDNAVKQGNKEKAQTYYERYLKVAEYYQVKFPEESIKEEIKDVKECLKQMNLPTPTPMPTVKRPSIPKEVQQLLTEADDEIEREHFLIAYTVYYEVLKLEPINRYAKQKMYVIAYKYKLEDPAQGQELARDLCTLSKRYFIAKMKDYQSSDSKDCSDLEDILYMLEYIKSILHGLFDPGKPEIEQEIMRINNYIQEFEQQYANLCK